MLLDFFPPLGAMEDFFSMDVGSVEVEGDAERDGYKVAPFPVLFEDFLLFEGVAESEGSVEVEGAVVDPFLPPPFEPGDLE